MSNVSGRQQYSSSSSILFILFILQQTGMSPAKKQAVQDSTQQIQAEAEHAQI
jgi:hypothetical protein